MGLTGRRPGVHEALLLLKARGTHVLVLLRSGPPVPLPRLRRASPAHDTLTLLSLSLPLRRACDYTGAAWKTQDNLRIFRSAHLQPPTHLLRCSLSRESRRSHSCWDSRVSFGGHGSTDPDNSREASSWAWAPDSTGNKTGEHTSRTPSSLKTVSRSPRRRNLPTWHVETRRCRPGIPAQMKPNSRAGTLEKLAHGGREACSGMFLEAVFLVGTKANTVRLDELHDGGRRRRRTHHGNRVRCEPRTSARTHRGCGARKKPPSFRVCGAMPCPAGTPAPVSPQRVDCERRGPRTHRRESRFRRELVWPDALSLRIDVSVGVCSAAL